MAHERIKSCHMRGCGHGWAGKRECMKTKLPIFLYAGEQNPFLQKNFGRWIFWPPCRKIVQVISPPRKEVQWNEQKLNLPLSSFDDLFSTEQRQEKRLEQVQEIPMAELESFQNNTFKVLQYEKWTSCAGVWKNTVSSLPADDKADGGQVWDCERPPAKDGGSYWV